MLRVRTQLTGPQGAPWLNTLFFTNATEDQTAANAAVSATGAFWNSVRTLMLPGVTFATLPTVDVITVAGGHTGAYNTTPVTNPGSATGSGLPTASQILCQLRTGTYINNREVRGRIFIPGLTTTSINATGQVATSSQTTVNSALNALIAATGAKISVWDRKHAGYSTVSSASCWSSFAVLRSRRD